ncbi:M48 family metallopeptidase [Endothiovibrio diazotrophicus]
MSAIRTSEERLILDGEPVPYRLLRDPRRKRLCLMVGRDAEVEVRVPPRAGRREIERFLGDHLDWLRDRLGQARRARSARPRLADGAILPLFDEQLELVVRSAARRRVVRQGGRLLVEYREVEELEELLEGWYRRQARRLLGARVEALAACTGLRPAGLAIRGQRTRWGSCSSRGRLNLNWRLLFAPSVAVDYVVIHELCHLAHMNHSAAFWALVARFDPDYLAHRKLLRAVEPLF